MEQLPDHIKKLLLRKLHGISAKADDKIIADWASQDPAYEEEIAQLTTTWRMTDEWLEEKEFDTSSAWSKIDQRIALATEKKNDTTNTVFWMNTLLKTLVAAAIVAGFIFGGWFWYNKRQESFTIITAATDQHITLSEGTTVWLRKGATIRFPQIFKADERKIYLSGEAYFDVKTIIQQPFRIETGKGLITVLGTSFLVNAGQQHERVAVVTGKVLFADKDHPQKRCTLSANEEAIFTGETFERKTFTSSPLQWQQEELSFRSTSLKEVIQTLTIFYNHPVKIDSTQTPGAGEISITASFGKESLYQAVDEIAKLTGLHYRQQQDTLILY
ncbi:FecR family protein [Chitinophaga sp. Ak27]|uniref:FecR family protein n=1 Tax=Chitinophaga sp. Ak27 TaxID=2726116 RepID=UPI00145E0978|nr:FecR family protein [Chitinophaga sp. Ak27]NLU91973.1 FecR family protein [Chitinophaga sp. Ak27]